MCIEQLEQLIEKQGNELQATLSLIVDTMTIGEVITHLRRIKSLEKSLEMNITKLDKEKDLEENNSKLEEF